MKRTGPTKKSMRELVVAFEKKGKKEKQAIWLRVSKMVNAPRRKRAEVSLWRIEGLAKKAKGKTLVVAGKVIGSGALGEKMSIAALEFSSGAKKAIEDAKGKTIDLAQYVTEKVNAAELKLVK
ncbi:MAG: 50S ribosomal protein L18e [Candidatus Diapherotrites archaeon]